MSIVDTTGCDLCYGFPPPRKRKHNKEDMHQLSDSFLSSYSTYFMPKSQEPRAKSETQTKIVARLSIYLSQQIRTMGFTPYSTSRRSHLLLWLESWPTTLVRYSTDRQSPAAFAENLWRNCLWASTLHWTLGAWIYTGQRILGGDGPWIMGDCGC